MGIVDILTEWDYNKRAEYFLKKYVFMKDGAGISCIEPKQYALRFQHALTDELLDNGEGTWDAGSGSEVSGAGSSTAALADAQPHAQREDSRKGPGLL